VIDEAYVLNVSSSLGLKIPEEKLESVTAQLQRIEAVAQALEGVDLDPFTDELAPVWRP
jgi:Asp-tRNA(Asn)/Glu-tRNA(Gln) amidotransferase C subunit